MGWATATSDEVAVTTATDTESTDAIYSGGEEAEDADVDADADANYYPSPGGLSTLASSVAVRGVHLSLPGGFCLL